jgi:phage terminase large subunit-like protein
MPTRRQPLDTSTGPKRKPGERITWASVDAEPRAPKSAARAAAAGAAKPKQPRGPRAPQLPQCGYTFDDTTCEERGEHRCAPRVIKVVGFFRDVLVHTKGRWARQRFELADWQIFDIVAPLFGTIVWSAEAQQYVRRYRIAWIELARKNGKSELLAGVALYLLVADAEEGAEIYGCARDRDQARKVFDVAQRMVQLSPVLRKRLKVYAQAKRIVDESTGSYYEIVPADASGNLGHNPHGVVLDEVISQRDGSLWAAMRTAMGARTQPLMIAATTAGDDLQSFAYNEHSECERIEDDPERARHVFVHMRNTPRDADPYDEAGWRHANPALGSFLSLEALRDEAQEARNDPAKENAFRQFRLNQWVSQASRWMPMHLFDGATPDIWLTPDHDRRKLVGRTAFAGLDLAAKFDLCAFCLLFPPEQGDDDEGPIHALWRFWIPEDGLAKLDRLNDNKFARWAKAGWVTVTAGSVIDYDKVIEDIAADAAQFNIAALDADEWSMWPIITRIAQACSLDVEAGDVSVYKNTYDRMSPGMTDVLGWVQERRFAHHGNPVARFCFDACEVRRAPYDANLVRPVKPERSADRKRIDAVPTAAMAANAYRVRASAIPAESAYEGRRLVVL